ncbi:MAG: replication protein [Candidatus Omnitrophica bacterium]|nr:replication protein [Candidatus Omnitrophota bacterium]
MKIGSPPLEKGHTRIANELLEAIIAYPFTAAQIKVILVVIRKTYGWRKKKSEISYGAISYLTGLNKRYIKKVVEQLIRDHVLTKEKNKSKNILGLNKRYPQWRLWITSKDGVLEDTSGVSCKTLPGVLEDTSKGVLQNTTQNKERNIYKESSKEKDNFYQSRFSKNKRQGFREYPKEPLHIKKIIKAIS